MKITRSQIRKIIQEEYGSTITGREKGMSVSANPPSGTTGIQPGDIVYLTLDAYIDADLHRFGSDWPPVTVTEIGNVEDLHGTTVPAQSDPPSDWEWVAGATGQGFVGEYEVAPGIGTLEDLVFPMEAIDWEYTKRGPKEPWGAGSGFSEGKTRITKSKLKIIIKEVMGNKQ